MSALFFGTSHVGMFYDAWERLGPAGRQDASFFAAPAPMLAKELETNPQAGRSGWKVGFPRLANYLSRIGQYESGGVDFRKFTTIVFVDMFFCYDHSLLHSHLTNGVVLEDGIPISWHLWDRIQTAKMGSASYMEHATVGTIERVSTLPLIGSVSKLNPEAKVYLVARPMMPAQRLSLRFGGRHSKNSVTALASRYDALATDLLASHGVKYVSRDSVTICSDTGASGDWLSVGWIEPERLMLNEHLTDAYAEPLILKILDDAS